MNFPGNERRFKPNDHFVVFKLSHVRIGGSYDASPMLIGSYNTLLRVVSSNNYFNIRCIIIIVLYITSGLIIVFYWAIVRCQSVQSYRKIVFFCLVKIFYSFSGITYLIFLIQQTPAKSWHIPSNQAWFINLVPSLFFYSAETPVGLHDIDDRW